MTRLETMLQINDDANSRITWKSDMDVWGKVEHWPTTTEADKVLFEDCDGFAVAKYSRARYAGIPIDQLALTICNYTPTGEGHMVLAWWDNPDDPWIMDNIDPDMLRSSQRTDLQPIEAFNEERRWIIRFS